MLVGVGQQRVVVADHLDALAARGTRAVIVCPVGFVADHIEVVWDLDNELSEHAAAAGITLARASTPNAQPRFAELALDLVDELRTGREPSRVPAAQSVPGYGQSIDGAFCTPECAANARLNPGSR